MKSNSSNGRPIQVHHLHLIQQTYPTYTQENEVNNDKFFLADHTQNSINTPNESRQSNEQMITQYLSKFKKINNIECQRLLGVNHQQASYALKKMNKNNQLKREGERRWAHYRLP